MSTNNETTGSTNTKSKDDGFLAASILVGTLITIAISVFFLWRNKKILGIDDNSWKSNTFSPPPERENYIVAKAKLNPVNPAHLDELKKLLMKRAIQAIPILLNLQNEGNSIERLYKRGMLTDDMHFKVKELKSFVDQEFQEVQVEAEDLVEGWGQHIWPQAMQFYQMIQKQSDEKDDDEGDDEKKLDDSKKKSNTDKKKTKKNKDQQSGSSPIQNSDSNSSVPLEGDALKAHEAEKMAKLLLEEDEKERNAKKNSASNSKVTPGKKQ